MKKHFLLRIALGAVLTVGSAIAVNAETVTRLVVWATDGERVSYELKDTPKVTFNDESIAISMGPETQIEVPMSTLSHFSYETVDKTVSGIDDPEIDAPGAEFADGNLVFTLRDGENHIEIVDIQGRTIVSKTLKGNGEHVYPLLGLEPGAYIVKFNGFTYKIMKR